MFQFISHWSVMLLLSQKEVANKLLQYISLCLVSYCAVSWYSAGYVLLGTVLKCSTHVFCGYHLILTRPSSIFLLYLVSWLHCITAKYYYFMLFIWKHHQYERILILSAWYWLWMETRWHENHGQPQAYSSRTPRICNVLASLHVWYIWIICAFLDATCWKGSMVLLWILTIFPHTHTPQLPLSQSQHRGSMSYGTWHTEG